jgi:hypothetical protein
MYALDYLARRTYPEDWKYTTIQDTGTAIEVFDNDNKKTFPYCDLDIPQDGTIVKAWNPGCSPRLGWSTGLCNNTGLLVRSTADGTPFHYENWEVIGLEEEDND